jgi:2-oxoglutarate dehydrogenase E2 component (dihydrolipoamide succinyltransferase)
MQERTGAHRAAGLLLRALLLAGAALVVVLIGASTAQADDADAAPEAPAAAAAETPATPAARPAHRLGSVADRMSHATAAAHRSTRQVLEGTTRTVREIGRQAPVAEPVTEPVTETVATVVDRTAGRLDTRVTEVTKAAEALVDGAVADVGDGVLAADGGAPEADVEGAPAGDPVASASVSDRRTDRADVAPAAPALASAVQDTPRSAQTVSPDPSHDLPPLDAILELGAFSGAPSAGSGAAGGPSPTGTLPAALAAPADVSLGVVTAADDERLFALPFTPGWSPD